MGFNLKSFPIFNEIDFRYLELVEPLFETFSCTAGALVLQQGKPADYFYLIVSGSAEVSHKPYDGDPITVAHIEKGGLFGWSVNAIEPLETMRIRGSALRKFCKEHPEAGKDLLERLATLVSGRWKNAKEQVKSILAEAMKTP
jgi:CRP-like cAMP-binding protein